MEADNTERRGKEVEREKRNGMEDGKTQRGRERVCMCVSE